MAAEQAKINQALDSQIQGLSPTVRELVEHAVNGGGKRLRPLLTLLTARAFGWRSDETYPMACALEILHTATLVHDDILDGAELRRKRKASHAIWGVNQAVLGGDVLLALGNRIMAGYGDPRLTDCISEAIMRTAVGEVLEIHNTWNSNIPRELYLEIITGKTAYLIQAACRCGAIGAGASPKQEQAAGDYGLNLGIAFQLVDDVLDYSSTVETAGKPVAADLQEGKLTLPLLLYAPRMAAAEKAELNNMLTQRNVPDGYAAGLAQAVREAGCDAEARNVAGNYLQAAAAALEVFPAGEERDMLSLALDYVRNRER